MNPGILLEYPYSSQCKGGHVLSENKKKQVLHKKGDTTSTYFCLSVLYCCVQSSNNFWFISMNSFKALYIKPWIVLKVKKKIKHLQTHYVFHTS